MSSDNLNAGASSFTPSGGSAAMPPPTTTVHPPAKEDSFRVYEEMMDTIEAEFEATEMDDLSAGMNRTFVGDEAQQGVVAVDPSLPPHLAHQAAEFWFPECRDCACCSGFKHACTCGGICKCSSSQNVASSSSLQPAPLGPGGGGGGGHGGGRGGGSGRGSGRGGGGKIPCKFLQSPQGCRFGDQCRFAHE